MMKDNQQCMRVVPIVLRNNDEILFVRKDFSFPPDQFPLYLPIGAVRYREKPEKAVARTLRALCGIEVKVTGLLNVYVHLLKAQPYEHCFDMMYRCILDPNDQEVVSDGAVTSDYEWIPYDQLSRANIADETRPLLRHMFPF